jgi:quinol monooxygenase YgiN
MDQDAVAQDALAQDALDRDALVRVVAIWRAAAGNEAAVRAIARDLAAVTGREPGCVRFEVLESASQPGGFVLIEHYAGAAAHAGHLASEHFKELVLTKAVPLLAHRDVQVYTVLTLEGSSNP